MNIRHLVIHVIANGVGSAVAIGLIFLLLHCFLNIYSLRFLSIFAPFRRIVHYAVCSVHSCIDGAEGSKRITFGAPGARDNLMTE